MNRLTEQDLRDIEAGAMLTQRQDKLMASELLSLREQLAALKALEPFCHVFLHPDGPLFNGIVSDSCAGHAGVIPLFTAAKPAED